MLVLSLSQARLLYIMTHEIQPILISIGRHMKSNTSTQGRNQNLGSWGAKYNPKKKKKNHYETLNKFSI